MSAIFVNAHGQSMDLVRMTELDVNFGAIADALAKICRFAGNSTHSYSAAQHSLLVAQKLPIALQVWGLLHDAHLAFIGDMTAPGAALLGMAGGGEALEKTIIHINKPIYSAAGIQYPVPADVAFKVHQAKMIVRAAEARDIMPSLDDEDELKPWQNLPTPSIKKIKPMPWPTAAASWLGRLEALGITSRHNQRIAQAKAEAARAIAITERKERYGRA